MLLRCIGAVVKTLDYILWVRGTLDYISEVVGSNSIREKKMMTSKKAAADTTPI